MWDTLAIPGGLRQVPFRRNRGKTREARLRVPPGLHQNTASGRSGRNEIEISKHQFILQNTQDKMLLPFMLRLNEIFLEKIPDCT